MDNLVSMLLPTVGTATPILALLIGAWTQLRKRIKDCESENASLRQFQENFLMPGPGGLPPQLIGNLDMRVGQLEQGGNEARAEASTRFARVMGTLEEMKTEGNRQHVQMEDRLEARFDKRMDQVLEAIRNSKN